MNRRRDFSLYCVTDRRLSSPLTPEEVVRAAVRGGATAIQLREKEISARQFIETGRALKTFLQPLGIPLIINDRIDVALGVGADGVHIGQHDMPYGDARRLLGPHAIIGLSVESMEQAAEAENLDIDYLGVSPIFSTPTKTDVTTEWGIEGLRLLRSQTRHVLVAIGGINASNAEMVIEAGADGLAVVSAICSAPDPERSSREIKAIIERARNKHRNEIIHNR
jgi:thiamine-phosphate pyrophosphorylase